MEQQREKKRFSAVKAQVEAALAVQNLSAARGYLRTLTSLARLDPQKRRATAELLLRAQEFVAAFRILSETQNLDDEGAVVFANAANFLGASGFALRLLRSVPEDVRRRRAIDTGQILATNYCDDEALAYLLDDPAVPMTGLLRCYSLLELGRAEEVLDLAQKYQNNAQVAPRRFAGVFTAWAMSDLGKQGAASAILDQLPSAPQGDGGDWPSILTVILRGIVAGRRGYSTDARRFLRRAWQLCYRPGLQPEANWLQILYWRGWISRRTTTAGMPAPWKRLWAYPTTTNSYRQRILQADGNVEDFVQLTPTHARRLAPSNRFPWRQCPDALHLYPQINYAVRDRQPQPRLTLPQRLLAALAVAGPLGVPLFRLFDTLWPDEPLSLMMHGARLEQAVSRLRHDGYGIVWRDNHLWIAPEAPVTVTLATDEENDRGGLHPLLAAGGQLAPRAQVEVHFGVSERTARRIRRSMINQVMTIFAKEVESPLR